MSYETIIQSVLDAIDKRIMENIRTDELAGIASYSTFHFCRIFTALTGNSVMNYVTRRKLDYAIHDLSQGKKIMDVATDYGFETHAGFTKAFKKYFGCSPSIYRLHVPYKPLERMTIKSIKERYGGTNVQVQIKDIKPFYVVGVASRHLFPNVKRCADIPAFWDTIKMDFAKHLTRLYDAINPAVHGEFGVCCDFDEESGEITYMLGVTFDENADEKKIETNMKKIYISGGLYAVFTTPKVPSEQYAKTIADTWEDILLRWFPESPYEYDSSRLDFEMYDERDHAWLHNNMVQMDICVPITLKQNRENLNDY